jgi:hypothetical protein
VQVRHGAIQGTQIPDPSSKYLVRAWGRMGVHHHRSSQQSDLNGSESTKTDAEKQDNDSGGAAQHSTRSTAPSSPRHTATGGRCRYHWDHRAETSYSRQQLQWGSIEGGCCRATGGLTLLHSHRLQVRGPLAAGTRRLHRTCTVRRWGPCTSHTRTHTACTCWSRHLRRCQRDKTPHRIHQRGRAEHLRRFYTTCRRWLMCT